MPLFRAGKPHWELGLSANLAMPIGQSTIAWSVVFDQDPAVWSPAAPANAVVDRDGLYHLRVFIQRLGIAAASRPFVFILVNGVAVAFANGANNTQPESAGAVIQTQLVAGDVVSAQYSTSSVLASTLTTSCRFEGRRVGPVRWT